MSKKRITNSEITEAAYDLMVAEEELILEAQMVIQRALNERGMSQRALADLLGVSDSYVSQMLGDSARNLTLRTIARVLKALGTRAVISLDDQVAHDVGATAAETDQTHLEETDVAVMASKVASSRLTEVWGQVIDMHTGKRSGRRKGGAAQAYGAYDAPIEEMALAA